MAHFLFLSHRTLHSPFRSCRFFSSYFQCQPSSLTFAVISLFPLSFNSYMCTPLRPTFLPETRRLSPALRNPRFLLDFAPFLLSLSLRSFFFLLPSHMAAGPPPSNFVTEQAFFFPDHINPLPPHLRKWSFLVETFPLPPPRIARNKYFSTISSLFPCNIPSFS